MKITGKKNKFGVNDVFDCRLVILLAIFILNNREQLR